RALPARSEPRAAGRIRTTLGQRGHGCFSLNGRLRRLAGHLAPGVDGSRGAPCRGIARTLEREQTAARFSSMQSEWHLDTDLLGLQHELLAHLADSGIVWFEDFTRVEADLGNGELKIYLTCSYERVEQAVLCFAREHGFPRVFYSPDKGSVYLR